MRFAARSNSLRNFIAHAKDEQASAFKISDESMQLIIVETTI